MISDIKLINLLTRKAKPFQSDQCLDNISRELGR